MANLATRSHYQDLFDFRRDFDQMFSRLLRGPFSHDESRGTREGTLMGAFAPAVEAYIDKDGKQFHASVTLPGVDPNDVNIEAQGNTLYVSGEREEEREVNEADYIHREIAYGMFQRAIPLPEGVDREKITAEYRNGILEIAAPIAAAALPRKIEVKALPAQGQTAAKRAGA